MKNEFFGKPFINSKVTTLALYGAIFLFLLSSCSVTKKIDKQAKLLLLQDTVIGTGHLGISVFDPAANSYWYNYNAEKYFTPASNTKLFSLYAGMKYLGDSLVGLRYQEFSDTSINIFPTGDPTFLHSYFLKQPVLSFLLEQKKKIYVAKGWHEKPLGYGWSWDDYNEDYMVERSPFPVFGNIATFRLNDLKFTHPHLVEIDWSISPKFFSDSINHFYAMPIKQKALRETADSNFEKGLLESFYIKRAIDKNTFILEAGGAKFIRQQIPFHSNGVSTAIQLLNKDYNLGLREGAQSNESLYPGIPDHLAFHAIHSQPTDSLFKPMMHYSDNFFAEQTLLMVSNEKLGVMNDEMIIDTLLKSDLKDIPQMPQWVDGSGLSRYNLFTPKDFVYLLNKMKNEFGLERLKVILPTGGEGTIRNYYKEDSGFIYVKTGTLSNQVALSGYLITQKNKLLIFSLLANNVNGSATDVRRAFERFLKNLRKKF